MLFVPDTPSPIADAQNVVRSMLKDPDSAKFGRVLKVGGGAGAEVICGQVGSSGDTEMKPFIYWAINGKASFLNSDDEVQRLCR
jgi:hypothetical protein